MSVTRREQQLASASEYAAPTDRATCLVAESSMSATALPQQFRVSSLKVSYPFESAYDEMFEPPGVPREHYQALYKTLLGLPPEEPRKRQQAADLTFLHEGITFTVYGSKEGTEKIFPNDLVPRIIPSSEWTKIEKGSRSG
jgi:hypothetical protein